MKSHGYNVEEQVIERIHQAAAEGNKELIIEMCGVYRISPGAEDKHGNTSLHWAAAGGHLDLIKFLLKHTSRVQVNKMGVSAFDVAHINKHFACCALMRPDMRIWTPPRKEGTSES